MKIYYAVNGYGLGHLTRALSLMDYLDAEFHIFTSGQPYEYLQQNPGEFIVHRIPGLQLELTNNKVDYWKSFKKMRYFLKKEVPKSIKELYHLEKPDLIISDYEPVMCRLANKWKKPFISLDNQHKFKYCKDLPFKLQMYAKIAAYFNTKWIPNPDKIIISTFHHDQIKSDDPLVNGLIRKSLYEAKPKNDKFTLVYLRDSISEKILESINILAATQHKIKIYGSTKGLERRLLEFNKNNVEFKDVSPEFTEDLINCSQVISSAGNQLIAECRHLQKPILAIPEPGQYEQCINGHYIEKMKLGKCVSLEDVDWEVIVKFVACFESTCESTENGTFKLVELIKDYI